MEFSNNLEKIMEQTLIVSQIDEEIFVMPSTPILKPMEAPLSMYLEMGVFYLEESDS